VPTATLTGGTNAIVEFNTGTLALPQLEAGPAATEFEWRDLGDELALCQRYYQLATLMGMANSGASLGDEIVYTPTVTMRAPPTIANIETTSELNGGFPTITLASALFVSGLTEWTEGSYRRSSAAAVDTTHRGRYLDSLDSEI
jgi:hypothetical protein